LASYLRLSKSIKEESDGRGVKAEATTKWGRVKNNASIISPFQ